MVNVLDPGSRGLDPKPRFVNVLCFPSRHSTLTVLLSTQDKWALADCQGSLIKFLRGEGVTLAMDQHPIEGEEVLLLWKQR